MEIDILTLFPSMFGSVLGESMLKRAQAKGILKVRIHNLRDWTSDRHGTADDKPFGGGPGMVMKIEPVYLAFKKLRVLRNTQYHRSTGRRAIPDTKRATRVVLLTPQGKKLEQSEVKRLAKYKNIVLVCGHYEGVDERIRSLVDEEISIGDYILTCGELPALVLIDAMARLIPGVLGHGESINSESFEDGLLEYPQYTRPAVFEGMAVPEVLIGGDHKKIEKWRKAQAIKRTSERRPDLLTRREE
jgi:tRNA (guanine37-N1)-methyltransferase